MDTNKSLLIEVLVCTVSLLFYENGNGFDVFHVKIAVCDSDLDELEGDLRERYPRSILRNYGLRGSRLARFWYLIRQFILMEWELSMMQGLCFSDIVFQRLGTPEVRLASTMNAG